LLFVGLPGSGKSLLAETLCRVAPGKYVARINQDALGNRKACLDETERCVVRQQGQQHPMNNSSNSVIQIDRCNVSKRQRRPFVQLASKLQVPVDCIVLRFPPPAECIRRCQRRRGHPTLPGQQAASVIEQMQAEWEDPVRSEGFRRVWTVVDDAGLQRVVREMLSDVPMPGTRS
jgi:atypical dual specificity phosphatase